MPWQRAGSVAVQTGSTTVTGINVDFAASSRTGDSFIGPDGFTYEVANVASATVISILPAYKGPTVSGAAYAIMPVQGYDKMLSDAFNNLNNLFGPKLAALGTTGNYDILPVAKGGTGATTAATALSNLGLTGGQNDLLIRSVGQRGGPTGFNVQGLYSGWNGNGLGDANFICNKGSGSGGFYFWSVNANNTAAGPVMIYSYDGLLTVQDIKVNGRVDSAGTWCRAGVSGPRSGTVYNFNWTGSNVDVYIDATYVGTMTLFGSDYRFKKDIADAPKVSYLDRIDAYRIVTYQRKAFGDVFKGDSIEYQGLIAHEAQAVNPLAVAGEKDGVDEDGKARVQQLEPMALITDLMGAIKELRAEVNTLKVAAQSEPDPVPETT